MRIKAILLKMAVAFRGVQFIALVSALLFSTESRPIDPAAIRAPLRKQTDAGDNTHSNLIYTVDDHARSLSEISLLLYNSSSFFEYIAGWNNIRPPYQIYLGQELILKRYPTSSIEAGRKRLLRMWQRRLGMNGRQRNFTPHKAQVAIRTISNERFMSKQAVRTPSSLEVEDESEHKSSQIDAFYVGLHFGSDYLSIDQSQTLGAANVGVLLPLHFQMSTGFSYRNISTNLRVDMKKFRYSDNTSTKSKWIHSLGLDMAYRWVSLRADFEQAPLFKNDGGNVQMITRTTVWTGLGFRSFWDFPLRKKTSLDWGAWALYPVTMDSNDTAVKVSQVEGYKVATRAMIKREITKWKSHELHYRIEGQISWEDIEFHSEWGASRGTVTSQSLGASTLIGLELSF